MNWKNILTTLGPVLALVAVVALFGLADGRHSFLTWRNLQIVSNHSTIVGVAALGMTIIIIGGGIDLSAGAAIALSATVMAYCLHAGMPPLPAMLVGILTGGMTGLVNGVLISSLRVVPFIITLGTMTIYQGLARILAADTPIRVHGKVPEWILALARPFPDRTWMLVSPSVWVMLVLAVLVAVLLGYSVFGRHVFAIGSNEATARLCGIGVARTRWLMYSLAGLFLGVAGLIQLAVLTEGDPTGGVGKELRIIAAVVIGGGSLSGGRGSVLGTLCGAALMAVIDNGCTILRIPDPFQDLIVGGIIILAVTLDQLRQIVLPRRSTSG